MQERLPLRPSMMPWSERAKTAVVIKVGNSTIRGKLWWGEAGLLSDVDCPKPWEVLSVRKATKGQEEEETEKLS